MKRGRNNYEERADGTEEKCPESSKVSIRYKSTCETKNVAGTKPDVDDVHQENTTKIVFCREIHR